MWVEQHLALALGTSCWRLTDNEVNARDPSPQWYSPSHMPLPVALGAAVGGWVGVLVGGQAVSSSSGAISSNSPPVDGTVGNADGLRMGIQTEAPQR